MHVIHKVILNKMQTELIHWIKKENTLSLKYIYIDTQWLYLCVK